MVSDWWGDEVVRWWTIESCSEVLTNNLQTNNFFRNELKC